MKLLSTTLESTYLTEDEYRKYQGTFIGVLNDIKHEILSAYHYPMSLLPFVFDMVKFVIFCVGLYTILK